MRCCLNIPAIADKQTVSPALQREDNYLSWENRQEVRDKYDAEMDPPKDYYFLPGEVEGQKFAAIKDVRQEFWAKVVAAQSEEEVESLVTEWGKTTKNMGIDEIIAERQAYMDNSVMAEERENESNAPMPPLWAAPVRLYYREFFKCRDHVSAAGTGWV